MIDLYIRVPHARANLLTNVVIQIENLENPHAFDSRIRFYNEDLQTII